jgi:hypothetical protein
MGYNTKFSGAITLSRPLTISEAKFILEANEEPDVIPGDHPRSYMQWVPTESLDAIVYDGNEKFYDYDKWLLWILNHLDSLGIKANGSFNWHGESSGDTGTLSVKDSVLTVIKGDMPKSISSKPLTLDGLARIALDRLVSAV